MKVTRIPMAKPLKVPMVMVFSRSCSVGVSAVTIQTLHVMLVTGVAFLAVTRSDEYDEVQRLGGTHHDDHPKACANCQMNRHASAPLILCGLLSKPVMLATANMQTAMTQAAPKSSFLRPGLSAA